MHLTVWFNFPHCEKSYCGEMQQLLPQLKRKNPYIYNLIKKYMYNIFEKKKVRITKSNQIYYLKMACNFIHSLLQ